MITITRTCDACKKCVPKKEQLWNVAVGVGCEPSSVSYYDTRHKAQWCRTCMEARGLCCSTGLGKAPAPEPTATLESLIREIVQEELLD